MNTLHVTLLLPTLIFCANALISTFNQMYISDMHISPCNPNIPNPITLKNVTLQIGTANKILVSGTAIISKDLKSPIKISVVIKKNIWFGWLKIDCIHNIGSCDFEDVCSFGIPTGEDCLGELKKNHVPCRCPIEKGIYTLPETSYKYFDDRSVISGKYKGSVTVTHYDEELACYNMYFTLNEK